MGDGRFRKLPKNVQPLIAFQSTLTIDFGDININGEIQIETMKKMCSTSKRIHQKVSISD